MSRDSSRSRSRSRSLLRSRRYCSKHDRPSYHDDRYGRECPSFRSTGQLSGLGKHRLPSYLTANDSDLTSLNLVSKFNLYTENIYNTYGSRLKSYEPRSSGLRISPAIKEAGRTFVLETMIQVIKDTAVPTMEEVTKVANSCSEMLANGGIDPTPFINSIRLKLHQLVWLKCSSVIWRYYKNIDNEAVLNDINAKFEAAQAAKLECAEQLKRTAARETVCIEVLEAQKANIVNIEAKITELEAELTRLRSQLSEVKENLSNTDVALTEAKEASADVQAAMKQREAEATELQNQHSREIQRTITREGALKQLLSEQRKVVSMFRRFGPENLQWT